MPTAPDLTALPPHFSPEPPVTRLRFHTLPWAGVNAWYPPSGHEQPLQLWRRARTAPR